MSYLPDYRNRPAKNYISSYNNFNASSHVNAFNSTSEAKAYNYTTAGRPKLRKLSTSSRPIPKNRNLTKAGAVFSPMYMVTALVIVALFCSIYGIMVSQARITGREIVNVENKIRIVDKRINELNSEKNRIAPIMSLEVKATELGLTETNPTLIVLEKKSSE